MDFQLTEEQRMLQDLVEKFVRDELMPLESAVLAREAGGEPGHLTDEEEAPLFARCKELGLWGLDVPEALGGANLDAVSLVAERGRCMQSAVPAGTGAMAALLGLDGVPVCLIQQMFHFNGRRTGYGLHRRVVLLQQVVEQPVAGLPLCSHCPTLGRGDVLGDA